MKAEVIALSERGSASASSEPPGDLPKRGLSALPDVVLDPRRQALLDHVALAAKGDAVWRARKLAEARDLLALAQIAPPGRLEVEFLDLERELRALLVLRTTVPCLPDPTGDLVVEDHAVLGLTVPHKALSLPLPGAAFVQILSPQFVWHGNVSAEHGQILCLGARLPAGIRVKEIVLLCYAALTFQAATLDERDAAGVMNPEAVRWWLSNASRIPLSKTPFLGEEGGDA
jgi:hypothetical protein